jgi:hypothetical protein
MIPTQFGRVSPVVLPGWKLPEDDCKTSFRAKIKRLGPLQRTSLLYEPWIEIHGGAGSESPNALPIEPET